MFVGTTAISVCALAVSDRDVYDEAPARARSDLGVTIRNAGHTGVRLGMFEVTLGLLPWRARHTYSFDLATRLEGGESQTFAIERTSPTDNGKEPAGIHGCARLRLESGETIRRRVRLDG